jgi:hypothetical protein
MNQNEINIYTSPNLQPKSEEVAIRIKLRRFLFWKWLEIEGAKAIPVYGE